MLVDTSAWIEFQRATGSAADLRLTAAIEAGESMSTTGQVILELLAGARDEHQARALRRLLDRCGLIPADDPSDHEAAAALYRACRTQGVTIRRLPDCLIAAVAIRANIAVLHRDADLDALAAHTPLQVVDTR